MCFSYQEGDSIDKKVPLICSMINEDEPPFPNTDDFKKARDLDQSIRRFEDNIEKCKDQIKKYKENHVNMALIEAINQSLGLQSADQPVSRRNEQIDQYEDNLRHMNEFTKKLLREMKGIKL